jgi:tRNA threonylcarbamoyladenosine biosynthesis protein TsaB
MLLLALDTSSAAGSVALLSGEHVMASRMGDPNHTHGERLPRELMALLDEAGVTIDEVTLLAVVTGPGSFTGLRVGIATMQGLALANDRLVVPVSAFEALAWSARDTGGLKATWIDAHRGEVFAALYGPDDRLLADPSSRPPDATLDAWDAHLAPLAHAGVAFLGDGAVRYEERIRERLQHRAVIRHEPLMLAEAIGHIAARHPDRAVRPHAVVPLYVRRPDAELARDRRKFD